MSSEMRTEEFIAYCDVLVVCEVIVSRMLQRRLITCLWAVIPSPVKRPSIRLTPAASLNCCMASCTSYAQCLVTIECSSLEPQGPVVVLQSRFLANNPFSDNACSCALNVKHIVLDSSFNKCTRRPRNDSDGDSGRTYTRLALVNRFRLISTFCSTKNRLIDLLVNSSAQANHLLYTLFINKCACLRDRGGGWVISI